MAALDVRPVFYVIGSLITILAVAMLAPMLIDLATGSQRVAWILPKRIKPLR
jgi:trk system potassium uptake protein